MVKEAVRRIGTCREELRQDPGGPIGQMKLNASHVCEPVTAAEIDPVGIVRRRPMTKFWVGVVAAMLTGSACGTRVAVESQGQGSSRTLPPSAVASNLGTSQGPSPGREADLAPAVDKTTTAPSARGANVVATPVGGGSVKQTGGTEVASSGRAPTGTSTGLAEPVTTTTAVKARSGSPLPSQGVVTPKSPVKVASVGTYSGIVGGGAAPNLQGVQVWVRYINAKGGVNGHPVTLNVVDDGGDPARHRAEVQEQIERENVIAFLNNFEPISGKQSVEYVTSKRVPAIGSDTGSQWFYSSPMYFPQVSSGDGLLIAAIAGSAQQAIQRGTKKFGYVFCQEAQICRDADRVWAEYGRKFGLEVVYRAQVSLAQPDFTAECISAKSAGVEVFAPALDPAALGRLVASCARQGYRPLFSFMSNMVLDRQKDDPNLKGAIATTNAFPYFEEDTPATLEFRDAMRKYGPSGTPNAVGNAQGWVSGKLFEKAAADLPEPATREALLARLWSIKDDDLGGLTLPLRFTRDQPAPMVVCWFNIALESDKWSSPDRFKRSCI
jgi:branched-chain amino acid transport system substrate-binding protein